MRMLSGGACDFFENPNCNAREAFPLWQPDPDITLSLVPDENPETIVLTFNLWTMRGHKVLEHDGRRLILKLGHHGRFWQVCIASALDTAMPFTFAVAPGDRAATRLREAQEMLAVIDDRSASFIGQRGAAEPIITMQSLQAFDGHLAGASERDIAATFFGQRIVTEEWHGDSELRAKVRYLIRRGRKLMDGGYRSLLWGETARRAGAFPALPTTGRKPARDISPYRAG